jgi:pilus assembly protein CpaF
MAVMPHHPVALITERVRERVRREGVDLSADRALADRYVLDEVQRYSERALGGSVPMLDDERETARHIVADLVGLGPLQQFLDDPNVEEIWINAPDEVYVARGGTSERTSLALTSGQVRDLVERMLQSTGRRVDLSSPFVDASLPDGSRLHVAIPDVTRREWAVNIRKFTRRIAALDDLVERGSLPASAAVFLRLAVHAGLNIIVSGATHAGKTTMLGALLAEAAPSDRVITVEETFELDLRGRDVVAMQCRQPSLEGTGEVTLRRLIKEALRMRPSRLVVGEVREAEALDLLIALNSGVPGACSVHANSAADALAKLSVLPLLAGRNIDSSFVLPTVASVVDLVVHCEQRRDGHRRVATIAAPTGAVAGGQVESVELFATNGGVLAPTGAVPPRMAKFEASELAALMGSS